MTSSKPLRDVADWWTGIAIARAGLAASVGLSMCSFIVNVSASATHVLWLTRLSPTGERRGAPGPTVVVSCARATRSCWRTTERAHDSAIAASDRSRRRGASQLPAQHVQADRELRGSPSAGRARAPRSLSSWVLT